jgi:aminomethyltransferase
MAATTSELKKTPLNAEHKRLNARIVEFAGWEMPVQYEEGVLKEHETVRTTAGIFDIGHMGEFLFEGPDVIAFIQSLVTNDLSLLENGKSQYACMCYPNGTVVDDLIYYQENPILYRMIVNGANVQKDWDWITGHIGKYNVKITNLSPVRTRMAFQGPKAREYLAGLVNTDLDSLKRFYFVHCNLGSVPIFLARTGYTGEDGFELSCANEDAVTVFNALLNTGAKPIGLGARDSLRLEACLSLYGHEISDQITPIEAGIGWVVKAKEGIDYIGKNILLKQKAEGTARKSVGINLIDKGIIREHYPVYHGDQNIGYVTSGGFAPTLKKTIGLALIAKEFSAEGTELAVEIRGKKLKAVVVKTPFFKRF